MGIWITKIANYKIDKQWIFWWILLFIHIFVVNLLKQKFNLVFENNIATGIGIFTIGFNLYMCFRSINYNLKQKGIFMFPRIVNILFAFSAVVFIITMIILLVTDFRSFWLWN